jgi:hypothetical protein
MCCAAARAAESARSPAAVLVSSALPARARVRRLRTTATNAAYWARRNPADHEAVAGWFADLSSTEVRTLHALLTRVEERVTHLLAGTPSATDAGEGTPSGPRTRHRIT